MRYWCAVAALLLFPQIAAAASIEYAVKAAYLYKFLPFVEWPQTTFPSADSPISICIVGKDPFAQLVDQAVAGQSIGGRAIVVRRVLVVSANGGCDVAYIGGSVDQSISQAVTILRGQPVLTITDSVDDPAERGIINLVVEDNKVRFEIDEHAAEQSHLTISSKLKELALRRQKVR